MKCKCGNEQFFGRYENNKLKCYVCSKCREEQPKKKEYIKTPDYKNEGENK